MNDHADVFTHDSKLYDLTKIRILTRPHPAFILPIRELVWILRYDTPDPKRVEMAKLRWPLLVANYKGRYTVVDGLHRLERCRQRGINVVPVKLVTEQMLAKCEIHTK